MGLLAALLPRLTTNIALLGGNQTGSGSIDVGAYGRNARPAMRFLDGRSIDVPLASIVSTLWLNVAITPNTFGGDQNLLALIGSNATLQCALTWNATGTLSIVRYLGDISTSLLGSASLDPAVDHVIDLKIVVHASAGSVDIYADGGTTPILSISGVNTQRNTTSIAAVRAGWGSGGTTGAILYLEHLLVMSETDTGDGLNGRLGSIALDPMRPDGAGDQTTGTPSAGANWQCEDDVDGDSDADSVSFSAAGGDRYTMSAAPFTTGTVKSLLICALMSKDDAGTVTARTQIKNGATVASGATVAIASTNAYVVQAYGTDPNTAAAWTVAGLNSVLAGPERVS